MSKPYLYKQYCPVCDNRMDPNADNLTAKDGEEVCSQECKLVRDTEEEKE